MEENEQAFSMYGVLDVHADTQWVRVMPIGETFIPADTADNGVNVTLTRERTGEQISLKDSLFLFGNEAYVWNYRTTEPIHPEEEYTIRAISPDGKEAFARVTTPSGLPLPEINYSEIREEFFVSGTSGDPIVTIDMDYSVQVLTAYGCTPESDIVISHLDDEVTNKAGSFSFRFNNSGRIMQALGLRGWQRIIVNRRELVIASGSEDWPDLSGLNPDEIVLPDVVSNVENGNGVVAGIASRSIEITPRQEPC